MKRLLTMMIIALIMVNIFTIHAQTVKDAKKQAIQVNKRLIKQDLPALNGFPKLNLACSFTGDFMP